MKCLLFSLAFVGFTGMATAASASIERVEYFVGEDPGRGNATELAIPEGESSIETELVFPPGSLPDVSRSQITVRAVDSEGNWTPPQYVNAITPIRPDDTEITLATAQFFFPEDSEAPEGTLLPLPSGETVVETEIQLPFEELPKEGVALGWAQAETSDGFRGPPVPFRVTAPPPERFAGQEIEGVAAWHYSLFDGTDVILTGTASGADDVVSNFDLRVLEPGDDYTLIVKPVVANGQPLSTIAADLNTIRDYEAWQRLHFTESERADDDVSAPGADPDGSGTTNFERFVAGIAPGEPFGGLRTGFEVVTENETDQPVLTLDRSRLAASTTLVLEVSKDLQNWGEFPVGSIDALALDETMDRLEIRPDNGDEPMSGKQFYRVRVLE